MNITITGNREVSLVHGVTLDEQNEIRMVKREAYGNLVEGTNIFEVGLSIQEVVEDALVHYGIVRGDVALNVGTFAVMHYNLDVPVEDFPRLYQDKLRQVLLYISANYLFVDSHYDPRETRYTSLNHVNHEMMRCKNKMIEILPKIQTPESIIDKLDLSYDPYILAAYDRGLTPCYRINDTVSDHGCRVDQNAIRGGRGFEGVSTDDVGYNIICQGDDVGPKVAQVCKSWYNSWSRVCRERSDYNQDLQKMYNFQGVVFDSYHRDRIDKDDEFFRTTHEYVNDFMEQCWDAIIENNWSRDFFQRELKTVTGFPGCHVHGAPWCSLCPRINYGRLGAIPKVYDRALLSTLYRDNSDQAMIYGISEIDRLGATFLSYASTVAYLMLQLSTKKEFELDSKWGHIRALSYMAPYFFINGGTPFEEESCTKGAWFQDQFRIWDSYWEEKAKMNQLVLRHIIRKDHFDRNVRVELGQDTPRWMKNLAKEEGWDYARSAGILEVGEYPHPIDFGGVFNSIGSHNNVPELMAYMPRVVAGRSSENRRERKRNKNKRSNRGRGGRRGA